MRKHLSLVCGALTMLVTAPAFAAELDFTSSAFSTANYQTSFSYTASDDVTVTISAGPTGARLYQDTEDGFGVRYSYETDEIESVEALRIGFSEDVLLTDILITDLFIEETVFGTTYAEVGYYTAEGDTVQFQAITGSGNGELTLQPDIWADAIVFRAPGIAGFFGTQNHEFSVGGLSYTTRASAAVPELDPSTAGTALLLLVGAAMMLAERKRDTTRV